MMGGIFMQPLRLPADATGCYISWRCGAEEIEVVFVYEEIPYRTPFQYRCLFYTFRQLCRYILHGMYGQVYLVIQQGDVQTAGKDPLYTHLIQGRLKIYVTFTFDKDQLRSKTFFFKKIFYLCGLPDSQLTFPCAYPDRCLHDEIEKLVCRNILVYSLYIIA